MAGLVIDRIGVGATVQDPGRPGRMHEGVPPGGPLVRELFLRANRSLGNDEHAAAIELPLHCAIFHARGDLTVSIDGNIRSLADGECLSIEPGTEAVHYLAVPGGIDVPEALGSRGTLLVAAIGGHLGRILRKGDELRALASTPTATIASSPPPLDASATIAVVRGPDFPGTDLFEQLVSRSFRISALQDRVGTRIEGAKLDRPASDRRGSFPMVRGALQVTTDGSLIALGPDHPTTGGYPVVGVIASSHIDAFARRRPGAELRFHEARPSTQPIL
jgi:allophanate hydrolase subunit 2